MDDIMEFKILVAEGCSSHHNTIELVQKIIDKYGIKAVITETVIKTDDQAKQYMFLGSPSIRINGRDIDQGSHNRTDYGLG